MVARAVVEEVVEEVFSLVLAGVGSVALLGEVWKEQWEVGGGFLLPILERPGEKSCCVVGDELGRQAGQQEG